MATDRWIDLLDPSEGELLQRVPRDLHPKALARLLQPHEGKDPRPTLQSHGDYVLGLFLVPVLVPEEDRVYYQEVGLVLTTDGLVTVRKTPLNGEPFDTVGIREACRGDEPPGRLALQIVEEIADGFVELIEKLTAEIDEVELNVEEWANDRVRTRLSRLRSDVAKIHQTLAPTREAVWQVADNRIEIAGKQEIFPKDVEIDFTDAHDRLMRAGEGLEFCRELLVSVREYHDSKLANEANEAAQKQSEIVSRLTVIASLLLLPALIVATFGMALPNQPGLGWGGLWWVAVGLCAAVTVAQVWFFKKKRWI